MNVEKNRGRRSEGQIAITDTDHSNPIEAYVLLDCHKNTVSSLRNKVRSSAYLKAFLTSKISLLNIFSFQIRFIREKL